MKATCLGLLLLALASAAADAPAPSLTGEWAGRWTDTRPEYSKSGGDFSCVAIEKSANVWTCTFKLGKTRQWVVELKGKTEGGKVVFGGQVDLGETQGVYTWKGRLNAEGFSGEYDGPDEKGTFTMTRVEPKAAAKK